MSALIFVALALAWAIYLIPKALKQHQDSADTRSIDTFSGRLRVLGRREAVTASASELVTTRARAGDAEKVAAPSAPASAPAAAPTTGRAAAQAATRRRRRVLGVLVLALALVGGLAAAKVIAFPYLAIPGALLVAWLVACRLMVRREIAALPVRAEVAPAEAADDDSTEEIDVVAQTDDIDDSDGVDDDEPEVTADPDGWDPVPTTLPTYVTKEPAPRTVRTIDLDSTGVWSSGHNAADAELVREVQAAHDARPAAADKRAIGS